MELSKLSRNYLSYSRAMNLLHGSDPNPDEIRMLAGQFQLEPEELVAIPLYTREASILELNIRYLVDVIPHGQKDKIAKTIGITPPQISRWSSGEMKPHKKNLRQLLKLHGIDPDLDLTIVPLFLALDPLSGFAQRSWIASRVQDLPASEIAKIYPALRKLLRYDD
jgi:transcriptional regulator with XRE-family HTH domain